MNKPKAFIVRMSIKNGDIPVDADEVSAVFAGITRGNIVRVRRGVINPSFFVGITEDVERLRAWWNEANLIIDQNRQFDNLGIGQKRELPQFTTLKDIFEGVDLKMNNNKLIS